MSRCDNEYRGYGDHYACEREDGHHGGHQSFPGTRGGWIWYRGWAHGESLNAVSCVTCGTRNVRPGHESPQCGQCENWLKLLDGYIAGRLIANGGELYRWEQGNSGAFGNRKVIVRMNDGRTFGPASMLWHMGHIPHEYAEVFTDNAELEWVL